MQPQVYARPYEDLPEATRKRRCETFNSLLEALIEVEQMIHANEMNEGTMSIVREAIEKGLGK